jgi:hypothetical protein
MSERETFLALIPQYLKEAKSEFNLVQSPYLPNEKSIVLGRFCLVTMW